MEFSCLSSGWVIFDGGGYKVLIGMAVFLVGWLGFLDVWRGGIR